MPGPEEDPWTSSPFDPTVILGGYQMEGVERRLTHELVFQAKEPSTLLDQTFSLQGNLLMFDPTQQDLEVHFDENLVTSLTGQLKTWVEDRLPLDLLIQEKNSWERYLKWTKKYPEIIHKTLSLAPAFWLDLKVDPRGHEKVFSLLRFFGILYVTDEFLKETSLKSDYPFYLELLSEVCFKALTFEYQSKEELIQELRDSAEQRGLDPSYMEMNHFLGLGHDLAVSNRSDFGILAELAEPVAEAMRVFILIHCWMEDITKPYVKNVSQWRYIRTLRATSNIVFEYYYMLDGLFTDPLSKLFVKQDVHLPRLVQLTIDATEIVHDLFSFVREGQEELDTGIIADNRIAVYHISQDLSFKDAIRKTLRIHNEKVRELFGVVIFLESECQNLIEENPPIENVDEVCPRTAAGAQTMLKIVEYIVQYAASWQRLYARTTIKSNDLTWEVRPVERLFGTEQPETQKVPEEPEKGSN